MRIGILTFHRSFNYGAFIQCYSLSKRLINDFPEAKIEVIDYATSRMYQNYPVCFKNYVFGFRGRRNKLMTIAKNSAKLFRDPKLLKRRRMLYKGFVDDLTFLPLSKEKMITDNYKEFFSSIKDKYDIIVVGSDAVWEFKSYPFPNAYFVNGDLGKTIRMSYAASSGRMNISMIDDEKQKYLKEGLSKFAYVGIRDGATERLLSDINEEITKHHNCDPTVFLTMNDFPKSLDKVKNDLVANGIDLSKPIIGVMGGDSVCKIVREMFKNRYQIVTVYYYSKYSDYYINDLSPIEWAQVFSLFSITVTRFFHGSLLSLKNGCPTIATDYWDKIGGQDTKIEDLYKRLGLKEHYFCMSDFNDQEHARMQGLIEKYINYPDRDKIAMALEKEAESYNSFREALSQLIYENRGEKGESKI